VNPGGFQVTPSDFPFSHYFSRRQAPIPGRVPINSLIGKPKTLRWRSVNAMLSALADGVERNSGESPCNIVAPNRRFMSRSLFRRWVARNRRS
jgi:hypothetical protein